ncbi:MAG: sulfurtransferase [Desulfobulbaceae bacterium]|nr:MAG: sulfurtransferase [Desulfobulbaceae bacterium]
MNWDTFFDTGESITSAEAKQFMSSGEAERYQLIDVRQPKEYEESHIPGAILIPLPELSLRQSEVDHDKPTIVYCRSGVRSKAACQILNNAGVRHVFNMNGGLIDWDGGESVGSEAMGIEYFASGDFETSFELAYQMEAGLKQFYLALVEQTDNPNEKETLTQMARFEDGHMAKLLSKYKDSNPAVPGENELNILEGGFDIDEMISVFKDQLGTPEKAIQLGMKFEAQAFDLYSRLARKHAGTDVATFYQEMANEEQEHLNKLSAKLEELL